ncbi:hypothetical protein MY11210_007344 [Beauveria gryllotalpidicola]
MRQETTAQNLPQRTRNSLRKVGDAKLEWAVVLSLHILIAGATAILAVGASALQSSSPLPSDLTKVKVSIALLTDDWLDHSRRMGCASVRLNSKELSV